MTLQEMIAKVPELSIDERKQLMHTLIDSIAETNTPKKHSIMELEGLGAEIWEGIDAQEYVNQLRSEWDHRP